MERTFINLVQKCICFDFLVNSLIISNHSNNVIFFKNLREENLRNIKIIYKLYKYIFNKNLTLNDKTSVTIDKDYKNESNLLYRMNSEIIVDLKFIATHSLDNYSLKLINILINSYFNFFSFINPYNNINISNSSEKDFIRLNLFYLPSDYSFIKNNSYLSTDFVRSVCIDSINLFFDYSLINHDISFEQYEIFYENDDSKRFYQYFFKSNNKSFKVRVFDKIPTVFYMYQNIESPIISIVPLDKNEALNIANNYLKEKFNSIYNNLLLDNDYINIESYLNDVESYKFKYNYKNDKNKINLDSGIYVTIDAKYFSVKEIELF